MKFTMKILVLFFGVLLLANAAYAESPREQLSQMVEQLQKSPDDNDLRENIIKLAQGLKPAPVVPEEAIKYEGRGQFRFKNAKSVQDYVAAAQEYEQAVKSAPWVDGYYSDLCTIYEKAEKYADAKRNCGFALQATGNPALTADLKRRIAGLDVGIEKENDPIEKWHREVLVSQENFPLLIRKLEGTVFVSMNGGHSGSVTLYPPGDMVELNFVRKPINDNSGRFDFSNMDESILYGQMSYMDGQRRLFSVPHGVEAKSNSEFIGVGETNGIFTISQDGKTLIERDPMINNNQAFEWRIKQ